MCVCDSFKNQSGDNNEVEERRQGKREEKNKKNKRNRKWGRDTE